MSPRTDPARSVSKGHTYYERNGIMKTCMSRAMKQSPLSLLFALALGGCASYGPPNEPYQSGNYYDQYSPAYSYYPGQSGYYDPYQQGYYGYPYQPGYYGNQPGYYGYPGFFSPSLFFGASSRGGGGIGVGATFGW